MLVGGARVRNRPWEIAVLPLVQSALETMANHTKDNLTIAAWVGAVPNVVTSNIYNPGGGLVAQGVYDDSTGVHAEVAAITALGALAWVNPHTIRTTLEPCHRCAVILRAFQATYGWTIEAPNRAYASNYPGAYYLPDAVYAVVIARIAPLALQGTEQTRYDREIKSLICGFGVAQRR